MAQCMVDFLGGWLIVVAWFESVLHVLYVYQSNWGQLTTQRAQHVVETEPRPTTPPAQPHAAHQ